MDIAREHNYSVWEEDVYSYPSNEPSSSAENASQDTVHVDNSTSVLDKIARLYAEKLMSDVCLVVDGKQYHCHRLILCASSDVFQVMLMSSNWTEYQNACIQLQEPAQCSTVFGDFLNYFYTGKIQINHVTAMPVMALADKYNVKDLMSLCKNYMLNHIPSASSCGQLMNWLQYSLACGHAELAEACRNFVKWNFQAVSLQDDFGSCEMEVLISLLKLNDLVIYDEMVLFQCVWRWIESQEEPVEESVIRQVCHYVRFPMMSPRQLADLLLCPLTQQYKDFFVERMGGAMAFHAGSWERLREIIDVKRDSFLFVPRLYTAEKWGTQLLLENYPTLSAYHTRTLMLSSPASLAECDVERNSEWVIEFSPKGVWFRKSLLIGLRGTVEVPEQVLRTVRLSLTLKEPDHAHVRVAVLVYGIQGGVEHIHHVALRNYIFDSEDRVLRFDHLVPFCDLNPSLVDQPQGAKSPNCFLVGPRRDTLKVQLVILPQNSYRRQDPCITYP